MTGEAAGDGSRDMRDRARLTAAAGGKRNTLVDLLRFRDPNNAIQAAPQEHQLMASRGIFWSRKAPGELDHERIPSLLKRKKKHQDYRSEKGGGGLGRRQKQRNRTVTSPSLEPAAEALIRSDT